MAFLLITNFFYYVSRQKNPDSEGGMARYEAENISLDMSFSHWMRRLCGRVSQWFSGTLYRCGGLHLALVPQGQPERSQRVLAMVAVMDEEGFGSRTRHRDCQAVCPKGISVDFIARMNPEYLRASLTRQVKDLDTTVPTSESS